jgi:ankyrin repeat protein
MLRAAALSGDNELVKELLEQNVPVDDKDDNGWTALHFAASFGRTDVAQTLLDNNAIIDEKASDDGWTPLHRAAKNGHTEVVQFLLRNGAAIAETTHLGSTALHIAAHNGRNEVVRVLVKNGAAIGEKDDGGANALHCAADNGHTEVVLTLLNNNAAIDEKDNSGWTALCDAARNGHDEVVLTLLDNNANMNEKGNKGITALHIAAWKGHNKSVQLLLMKNAPVDGKDDDGWTALHCAARKGCNKVVHTLLENHASTNEKAKDGSLALHIAAQEGHNEVVQTLLMKDAAIDEKNNNGWTALHSAARDGHNEVVQTLLQGNAKVDEKQKDGWTALHLAAAEGHNEVVQTLLENNAAISETKKKDGKTALHVAAANGHNEVVQTLLKNNAAINEKENDGWTALHLAAQHGHNEVVQTLLKNNAATDEKTNEGSTALQFAHRQGHSDVVATLAAAFASQKPTWTMPTTDFRSLSNRELGHEPWWRPNATRASAEAELATLPIGCFLVRPASTDCCLALSLVVDSVGSIGNIIINYHGPGAGYSHMGAAAVYPTVSALLHGQPSLRFDVGPAAGSVLAPTSVGQPPAAPAPSPQLPPWPSPVAASTASTSPRPQRRQNRVNSVRDLEPIVADQRSVTRAPSGSTSTAAPHAPSVLKVDWELMMSQSGLQTKLASMQAAIAASDRELLDLRAADAQLDSRVAANATRIAEHHERLAELEQRRQIQSTQLDILHTLQHKPAQLLFYRTLLINIEAVFASCKVVMGGFVDLGGDAASSKTLTGAAKATRVCGTVLSLLPGGALIKGAANLTAAALELANTSRRQNIVTQLGKNLTQDEASQVASDVAHRLTIAFAAQLELLAPIEQTGEGSSGGGFLSFLKSTCVVGGQLAAAYVTSGGDGSEVIATAVELAKDAASEQATELLATKFGALVGSVENGPDPFASVLADFCFLCALAELENVRARETPNELAERLVHAVLELKPTAVPASGEESGARRLLNRLRGAVKSALSNAPSRSLSVFIRSPHTSGGGAPWREVAVFDLLTRCGVRTKTGHHYTAAHCDTVLFGWCEATEVQAGSRGLAVQAAATVVVTPGGPRGAALDLAQAAQMKSVFHNEMKKVSSATRGPPPPAVVVDSAAQPRNEYDGAQYGRCTKCDDCREYVRPKEGARCEVCDCAVLKHAKMSGGRSPSRSPSPTTLRTLVK